LAGVLSGEERKGEKNALHVLYTAVQRIYHIPSKSESQKFHTPTTTLFHGLTGTILKKKPHTSATLPINLAGLFFNPSRSPSTGSSLALSVNIPEETISWRSEERREWYACGERAMDEVICAETSAL